jgi:hypothetical protein
MAEGTGMKLVLLAGGLTFSNEWLQTRQVNWRVPVATVLAAALVAGVGKVSPGGGTGLGVMALIVAAATPFNGKSPIQEIGSVINKPQKPKSTATATGA